MKIVKQSLNDSCVAAVLAMIIKKPESYVLDWFLPKQPPLSTLDAAVFLAFHGYIVGSPIDFKAEKLEDFKPIWPSTPITVEYVLKKIEAILIVATEPDKGSEDEFDLHAVYWDGKRVWDPNPETPRTGVSKYCIDSIIHIVKTDETLEYIEKHRKCKQKVNSKISR